MTAHEMIARYCNVTGETLAEVHADPDRAEKILTDMYHVTSARTLEAAADAIRWWGCFENPEEYLSTAAALRGEPEPECPGCAELRAEVERLEAELAQLEANALEAIRRLTLQRDELRAEVERLRERKQ